MQLATQDSELVPKHDDLQLFELMRTWAEQHDLQQAAQSRVAERPEQESVTPRSGRGRGDRLYARTYIRTDSGADPTPQSGLPSPENRINAPHT
jgi:hypothetical protein